MERELHYLRAELDRAPRLRPARGRHPRMVRLYELIAQVAPTHATVLITGESGTGKELVARAHPRPEPARAPSPSWPSTAPRSPTSCSRRELFGHEKGAFTGAHARKRGQFELAHGGTLFLDEVGELRVDCRPSSCARCRSARSSALGGTARIQVDVRVIAATNRDLAADGRARRTFREDLYYRLNVVPDRACRRCASARRTSRPARRALPAKVRRASSRRTCAALSPRRAARRSTRYDWPGNVRELENVIERSVALATPARDPPRRPAAGSRHARGRRPERRASPAPLSLRRRAIASSRPMCCARSSARTGTRAAPPGSSACIAIPFSPGSPPGASVRRAGDRIAARGGRRSDRSLPDAISRSAAPTT